MALAGIKLSADIQKILVDQILQQTGPRAGSTQRALLRGPLEIDRGAVPEVARSWMCSAWRERFISHQPGWCSQHWWWCGQSSRTGQRLCSKGSVVSHCSSPSRPSQGCFVLLLLSSPQRPWWMSGRLTTTVMRLRDAAAALE
jgi:hypothetical protein